MLVSLFFCAINTFVQMFILQDFLRSAVIPNEESVLQAASAVAHLDTHIGQGGIDLMVYSY